MEKFLVSLLDEIVGRGCRLHRETQTSRYRFPLILICHSIVTAELVNGTEESVEVYVLGADHGTVVYWRTTVVHEFVQLSHEVVLLLAWLVVRALYVPKNKN